MRSITGVEGGWGNSRSFALLGLPGAGHLKTLAHVPLPGFLGSPEAMSVWGGTVSPPPPKAPLWPPPTHRAFSLQGPRGLLGPKGPPGIPGPQVSAGEEGPPPAPPTLGASSGPDHRLRPVFPLQGVRGVDGPHGPKGGLVSGRRPAGRRQKQRPWVWGELARA